MGGLSFGSEVTLWTATHSDLLAAASITSPSIEPNYYLFNTLRDGAFFDELKKSWGLGSPDETPDRWRTVSPVPPFNMIRAQILFPTPEPDHLYSCGVSSPLIRKNFADLRILPQEKHEK